MDKHAPCPTSGGKLIPQDGVGGITTMVSRRDVLIGGGAGLAALGLGVLPGGISAAVPQGLPARPVLFLADSTIAAEVAAAAARAGVPTVYYTGDIGVPWFERLGPLWRQHPHPVAGVTYGGAFFCLEQLARTCGLACTLKIGLPWSGRGQLAGPGAEAAAAALFEPGAGQPSGREALPHAADRPLAWLLQPAANSQAKG